MALQYWTSTVQKVQNKGQYIKIWVLTTAFIIKTIRNTNAWQTAQQMP